MALPGKMCVLALAQLWLLCACTREAESPQSGALDGSGVITHSVDFPNPSPKINSGNSPVNSTHLPGLPGTELQRPLSVAARKPQSLIEEYYWLQSSEDGQNQESLHQLLEKLNLHGRDAIFAIRDLLLLTDSLSPDEQELRQAFLALLLSFESPEVEGIALQLLENAPVPMEIWLLGRYLERVQPGIYKQTIRLTAEQALLEAQLSTHLPGEFLQLIGEVGNESTVSLLLDLPIHMNAYSRVALALIEDGSGISQLEQDARLFETGVDTNQGRLAILLLAQEAYRQEAAAEVLLELAGKSLFPQDLWPEIALFVAGGQEITLIKTSTGLLETSTIYRPEGDQKIYRSDRRGTTDLPEQIDQRLYLLRQLQRVVPAAFRNEFAVAEGRLNQHKDSLSFFHQSVRFLGVIFSV